MSSNFQAFRDDHYISSHVEKIYFLFSIHVLVIRSYLIKKIEFTLIIMIAFNYRSHIHLVIIGIYIDDNCLLGNLHFILTVRFIYDSYKWFQFIRRPGKVERYICLLKYKWDTENGKTRIKYLVSILESMARDFFQSMVYN